MIRLVAMDVDGTLTDGGIYLDGRGGEMKRFDSKDGWGIRMLRKAGIEVAFISGRRSAPTDERARGLGVSRVVYVDDEKLPALREMASELGLDASEVAFIGDDTQDAPCMRWAGLGVAVADASRDALEAADWVAPLGGGRGAVRAAADMILARDAAERERAAV